MLRRRLFVIFGLTFSPSDHIQPQLTTPGCARRVSPHRFRYEMNPTLVIDNSGRRQDGCYLGFLVLFWMVWTPATAWATLEAFSDFQLFWALWLPFGYIGVLGIPFMLWQSRKPQVLESAPDSLQIRGTGLPFARFVTIPRGQKIKLHFGHYGDDGEGESVANLEHILRWLVVDSADYDRSAGSPQ